MSAFPHLPAPGERALIKGFAGGSLARFAGDICREHRRTVIIIAEDAKQAGILADETAFFHPDLPQWLLPAYDALPYHGLSPHPETMRATVSALLALGKKTQGICIAPVQGFLRRHLPRSVFTASSHRLTVGFTINREQLLHDLITFGYERSPLVEESGQFAVRGDVIDVFPPQETSPWRLSLFDREIESLRRFDPVSQRTAMELPSVEIIPVREIFLSYCTTSDATDETRLIPEAIRADWQRALKNHADARDIPKVKRDHAEELIARGIYFHGIETLLPLFYARTSTICEYLPENAVILNAQAQTIDAHAGDFLKELSAYRDNTQNIEAAIPPEALFLTPAEVRNGCARHPIYDAAYDAIADSHDATTRVPLRGLGCVVINGATEDNQILRTLLTVQIAKLHNLAPLAGELNQKRLAGYACSVICQSPSQAERMRDLLTRFDLPLAVIPDGDKSAITAITLADRRLVRLSTGTLHAGFLDSARREWWITDEEVFGKKPRRTTSAVSERTTVFSSFAELNDGDYVIHLDHGIGIYKGLVKLDFDPNKNDFLVLEYMGGDKLYVPVDRLNRVQRYSAEEGSAPALDKLGGTTWVKVRGKAKRSARKLAGELLKMQAVRAGQRGYAFQPHFEEMLEFSSGFEFEETPDQERAITEVLADMGSERPMDRLVCGDVGFGKTEVAIRAAYKAVLDRKQAAVLVPTTVLAFQHYATFKKRCASYAISVELLSRFRSEKEIRETLKRIKEGAIDIVVGTHRLLSQDVKFNDLGLLIVDEEHRFGVVHKERIKKMKHMVPVLTLTATPIPRTLNFALNGIRDLSIINTPPIDRLAIKTYACSFDAVLLKDAMQKEIKRGGQVYFVHNRVQSIDRMATEVQKMLPEARVRVGHGQMSEDLLERVMIDFMNHSFDVLVCSTIVESGLDIPNCNTMIINRADHLGLAQLYQLRGRIGRSHHQAYCYLIVPDEELINTKARKRLAAIQKFTELGSGFKVASHDLEIRGAGNILGDEQSGHIASVGYDMYVHLLKEAIHELKDERMPEDFAPEVILNIPARIPEEFIPDTQLRLLLYKQLSSCENTAEVVGVAEEWSDRFGDLPPEIKNLLGVIRVRIRCRELLIAALKQSGARLAFSFHANHRVETGQLAKLIQKEPKTYALTRDGQFTVTRQFVSPQETIGWVEKFLGELRMEG